MRLLDKYYYVVSFRDFIKPKIYPVFFTNKKAAKRAIRVHVGKKRRPFFDVLKGSKLKDFELSFMFTLGALGKFTKYDYPKELDTIQKRKNFRTIMRRRLRRMGMLTPAMSKYHVRKSSPYIKLIQNRQWVADSPYTIAKVFRLERKPSHIYYIILSKELSRKKGILFEVDSLRVDVKRNLVDYKKVQIYRNDIIIPYIMTDLIQLYGAHILDIYRKEGLRFFKRKRDKEKIHQTVRQVQGHSKAIQL